MWERRGRNTSIQMQKQQRTQVLSTAAVGRNPRFNQSFGALIHNEGSHCPLRLKKDV